VAPGTICYENRPMPQRARLHAVLDTVTDAVIITDSLSRIETFNARAEQMFGYAAAEVLGKDLSILMPEPYRSQHAKYVSRFLAGGAPRIIGVGGREVVGLRKDGTTFPAEIGVGVLIEDGATKFTGIVRDLTERKLTEAKLRQAQKLEAIGQLASGIAHDFNNLLMAISGCAEMAALRLDAAHDAVRYLESLQAEVQRGSRITRQLLAFGRADDGELVTVAADAVLRETTPLLRRLLGDDIQLDLQVDAENGYVRCRSGELEQAVLNLAINARDAMPSGGRLTIRSSWVDETGASDDADALPRGRYVSVRVVDEGTGMSEETLARIFDPFFTTKPEGKGTGLGLAIVYGAAQHAGGAVRVDSELGRGTSFELLLPGVAPLATADARLAAAARPDDGADRAATILIAEDQALVRRVVRHRLERAGYRVLDAADGSRAIEAIRSHPEIALVITDVVLPGASGADVAAALAATVPGARAIFMSAHPRALLVDEGRIPADAVALQKPFDADTLLATVRAHLADPRADEPARRRRVLLVEDEPVVRRSMSAMLAEIGCDADAVATGGDAIRAMESAPDGYDLVVTDLGLPDMTGWTLADELRDLAPEVGVVFASGSPEAEARSGRLGTSPTVGFLAKPVSRHELRDAVARVLEARERRTN